MSRHFSHGYALLVGVGCYRDAGISDLPATLNDAQGLHKVLLDQSRCGYYPDHVKYLSGSDATKANILAGLDWLADQSKQDPESTILFYFSGHGARYGTFETSRYYIVPHDCSLADVDSSAIGAELLSHRLDAISALRIAILIDACHSGGSTKDMDLLPEGYSKSPVPPTAFFANLQTGRGRVIISSSREDERSFIKAPNYEQSIFTYHLLEGLMGEAYTHDQQVIGIIDLFVHLATTVPTSANQQIDYRTGRPALQHPIMDGSKTDNFPIALLPIADRNRAQEPIDNRRALTLTKINQLKQRRKELRRPLKSYIAQRVAIEEDIALASLNRQKQVILQERLKKVNREIRQIQDELDSIDTILNEVSVK